MDILEFIAALVDALAWPAAVVTLALLFRRGLSSLIPALTRLKWKDLELEFKQELTEIARTAQAADLPPAEPRMIEATPAERVESPSLESEIEAVAEVSPRAAVPLAWAAVESELLATVTRVLPDTLPSKSAHQNTRQLQHAGVIGHNTVATLNRMRELRNRVVHGDFEELPMSRMDAIEYSNLAQQVIAKLRSISSEPRGDG